MFTRPSSPRSIGGVLDDSIRLYAASWRIWLLPAVISGAISAGIQVAMAALPQANPANPLAVFALLRSPVVLVCYLLVSLVAVWIYSSILAGLDAVYSGREASTSNSFSTGLAVLPSMILAGIVFGLGVAVGFILLIVPGLILMGRWTVYAPALIAERSGGTAALGRSWKLVKGHWWRTATVLTVAVIILVVIAFGLPLVAGIVAGVSGNVQTMQLSIIVLTGVERVVTAAAIPAVLIVTYYDLRLRLEGGDLSARVDALAAR